MEAMDIRTGDRLLVVIESGACEACVHLPSHLVSIENNQFLVIGAPRQNGVPYPLRPGQRISLTYHTEKCLKLLPAEVEQVFIRDSMRLVRVRRTGELQRIQRRSDYRLPFFETVSFSLRRGLRTIIFEGRAMDVSGGGIRFLHNEQLLPEDELTAMFIIDGETMQCNGRISYIRTLENHPNYLFCTGVQFVHSSRADKEKLVRSIFRLQRALMCRE